MWALEQQGMNLLAGAVEALFHAIRGELQAKRKFLDLETFHVMAQQ
jgi:hypothetical protein